MNKQLNKFNLNDFNAMMVKDYSEGKNPSIDLIITNISMPLPDSMSQDMIYEMLDKHPDKTAYHQYFECFYTDNFINDALDKDQALKAVQKEISQYKNCNIYYTKDYWQ